MLNTHWTRRFISVTLVSLSAQVFVPWQVTRGHAQASAADTSSASDHLAPNYPTMPAGDKRISGTVYNEKKQPVVGIGAGLVWHWSQKQQAGGTMSGENSVGTVSTDTHGRFSFTNLPAGDFDYEVFSRDNQYVTQRAHLSIAQSDAQKFLHIVVSKGALVTGRVLDGQTGKPMAGIFVGAGAIPPGGDLAKWGYWEMLSTEMTDAQGRYQVRVTPGRVFVGVGRSDNGTALSRRIRYAVKEVKVLLGKTASAPDLAVFLRPVIVCMGPDGQPVANTTFRLVPEDLTKGAYITEDRTDNTGTVVLGRMEDDTEGGSDTFSITQGDVAASGTVHWSPGSPLEITMAGQTTSYPSGVGTVRLREGSTSPVIGNVVSEDGMPIPNARIRITETDPKNHYGLDDHVMRTDASGAFRVSLDPSGEYHANIRADGFNQVSVSDAPLSVVKGKTTDLGIIHLVRAEGFVSGRIVDAQGKPMSGVLVYVQGGKTCLSAAVTDDRGEFRIPNVVVGEALNLELCLQGEARDSGEALSQSNEEMHIPGVKASLEVRQIVWHPQP